MAAFYAGAKRIERFLDKPRVEKFMDALTMWWLVAAALFVVAAVVAIVVQIVLAVV